MLEKNFKVIRVDAVGEVPVLDTHIMYIVVHADQAIMETFVNLLDLVKNLKTNSFIF
jgi:hypothetical protein